MADGQKRDAAKRARRDARRSKARREPQNTEPQNTEPTNTVTAAPDAAMDTPLLEEVRQALDGGHPVELLTLVSTLMLATSSGMRKLVGRRPDGTPDLGDLVPAFVGVRVPETTALLAVLGELLPDGDALRVQCREEVATRAEAPPAWLAGLAQATVPRAVRMGHVLGDFEELIVGVRLADGQEMTSSVYVDHLAMSSVKDAFFVPLSVDVVVAAGTGANTDPDVDFSELNVADAGAELRYALAQPLTDIPYPPSETWPGCYATVHWLARLFPDGGSRIVAVHRDWDRENDVIERFFTSPSGRPFDDVHHRSLLEDCADAGTGDPLRWSADRLRQLLTGDPSVSDSPSAETQLDVPELLRAFVPFAHAESGIGRPLTDAAVAVVDEFGEHYRMSVAHALAELDGDD